MNCWIIFLLVVQYLFIGTVVAAITAAVVSDEYEYMSADAFAVALLWPIVLVVLLLWLASKPFAFAFRAIYTEMLKAKRRRHENHD